MAAREDPDLVRGVLDYRNAKHALDLFNDGSKGASQLQKQPQLMALLLEMKRAQGANQTVDELMAEQPTQDRDEES